MHVDYAVCINIKGNFNLRHTTRCRRNSYQIESSEFCIVIGHLTLSLQNPYRNSGLIITCCRKNLAFFRWNSGISFDQFRAHAAKRLYAQRQRRYVQKQNVFRIAFYDGTLHGRTHCYAFHGIYATLYLFSCVILYELLHNRHSRRAAHHDNLIYVFLFEFRVLQGLFHGMLTSVYDRSNKVFQFCAVYRHCKVLWACLVSCYIRKVYLRCNRTGEFNLGLFSGFAQSLHCHLVIFQINAVFFLKFRGNIIDKNSVHVRAAKLRIPACGKNFESALGPHFHYGNVKRPAS